jgi:phosphoribosylanthranilate isomerase
MGANATAALPADRLRVKICGLRSLADAMLAADAGADYLGFIFYPLSVRAVTAEQVRPIAAALRDRPNCPILVGVFVDEPAEAVARVLEACDLDLAQLSGDEPPEWLREPISPLAGRSYKAVRPETPHQAARLADTYRPARPPDHGPDLLLDTFHPVLKGGTGQTADWEIGAQVARTQPRLMLAGGLSLANVAQAVARVRPYAVDVASGVERAPGVKDERIVQAFIDASRAAARQAGIPTTRDG